MKNKVKELFTKKEKSEIDKQFSKLKKVINKRDEYSSEESLSILIEISKFNQMAFLDKLQKLSTKSNKILDGLSAKVNRLSTDTFNIDIIQEIIDYCFRFGKSDIQRNGVILLEKYKDNAQLFERYKLIFLKDKKAYKLLQNKIYN